MGIYIFLAFFTVLLVGLVVYFAALQYQIEQNIRRMNQQFDMVRQQALAQARSEAFKSMTKPNNN